MAQDSPPSETIHASCVAKDERAVVILGASGTGKSSLALQLMGLGAHLVSDDRTCLSLNQGHVVAYAPASIKGQIEARFIGILAAPVTAQARVQCVVDLDQTESQRLPEWHVTTLLGQELPLIRGADTPHFASALYLYLTGARLA